MTWWVITKLTHTIGADTLGVQSRTHGPHHLYMAWGYHEPRRVPIYVRVRGTLKFCGYRYVWDTPNIEEQQEPGDTSLHSFYLSALRIATTIWYYLWSIPGPYGLEVQGPLISVNLEELVSVAARVYHDADQPIPSGVTTTLAFNSERFDTDDFHDLVIDNSRLTCPVAGIYQITAHVVFADKAAPSTSRGLYIRLNGSTYIGHAQVPSVISPSRPGVITSTLYELEVGDYVEARVYQNCGVPLAVKTFPEWSPEFMIVKVA